MAATHVVSIVVRASALAGALFACAAAARAQQAAPAVRERALSPALREMRADVLRPAARAGQVVLDARKVATGAVTQDLVATDLAGRAVALQRLGGASVAVQPAPDQWVVVRPTRVAEQAMARGLQWLPGVCLAPPAAPGGTPDVLAGYADFSTVPVVWDTDVDAYRISGHIGVARNGDPSGGGAIGRTATVKLGFSGVSAAPERELAITRLGIEGEQRFVAEFARTDAPTPRLVVRSSLGGDQPYQLDVRPRVELTPRRNPILGLGLEEIVVALECVQAHGAPVALGGASPVALVSSAGRESGAEALTVSPGQPRTEFRFRSTWLGPARIVATARTPDGAIVGSVVVRQAAPWPQVLAAILGGALGGYARRFMRGARRRVAARRVVEGTIVGLLAFVAGVLGVGFLALPEMIVATVAGAFLVAALAGFAGVVVLERMQPGRRAGAEGGS